jgi:hypothetical protein
MEISTKTFKLINIQQTQQHPFHVLSSSKLPITIATLSGGLALTFIAKLHNININELPLFSFVANQILNPFFSTENVLLWHFSTNITIIYLILFLIIAM